MAEENKINFYPKPVPPTHPRVLSFNEIQRLLAQAPAPPTHKPGGARKPIHIERHGPKKAAIQCTNRGTHKLG